MCELSCQNDFKHHKKHLLFLLVFSLSLCWILLLPYTVRTHDAWFHLERVESLVTAFQNGDWFPRIFPYVYDNFGYSTSLFYSDFFLYIPALLTFWGMEVLTSYKIYLALIIVATAFCSYYCIGQLTGSKLSASLGAMAYTGSSYFAVDLFLRGALGESQAFIFVPFALLGIYNTVYGDEKKIVPLVIGFAGLVLSHNLSLLLMALIFAMFLLLNAVRLFRQPTRIVQILKGTLIVVFTTAFFLFPMVEQLVTEDFFSEYHTRIWNPGKAAIRVRNLFVGANLTEDPVFTPSLGVTMLVIILICLLLLFKRPRTPMHRFFTVCMLGLFGCLFACTSIFPWYPLDPYLNIIQFPSRFFLFITLFAAFCLGIWSNAYLSRISAKAQWLLLISAAVVCCFQFSITTYKGLKIAQNEKRIITDTSASIFWDENYLNGNNNRQLWEERESYIDTARGVNGQLETSLTRDYYHRYITYSGNEVDNALEIAAVYYRGYKAIDLETGQSLPVSPSANGWLQVDIGTRESGKIDVFYAGTAIQHISVYISGISILALVLFLFRTKAKAD